MNIKKSLAFVALTCLVFVGCKQTSNEKTDETKVDTLNVSETPVNSAEVTGKLEKASFEIEGMSCAVGCAKVIEGKLAKLDGVKSATVDFESKTAKIEFDNAKQTTTTIEETVEKIADGIYKVENMSSSLESAMLFDQEPKKGCCSGSGKSCDKGEKSEKKDAPKKETTKKEKKANIA